MHIFSPTCVKKKQASKHPQNKNKNLTDIVYSDKETLRKVS